MTSYPSFLKNLPAPVQLLVRPMLLLSVGVHGLLLLLPIPSQENSEPPLDKKPVRVTQLPPRPSLQPSPTVALPTPSPQVQPRIPLPAKPSPTLQLNTALPVKPSPRIQPSKPLVIKPSPKVEQPKLSPIAEQTTPVTSPTPTPTTVTSPTPTPTPTAVASPTPIPTPTPVASATPTPTPSPTANSSPVKEQFADFPQLDGSQPGCEGIAGCWQAPTTNWRIASRTLISSIEAKGYSVDELSDLEESGRKVYEVSKQGETQQYLNIFSIGGDMVYRLAEKPLSREELNQELQTDADS